MTTIEEHQGGCMSLGFDLWRRSMATLGMDFEEKRDV